MVAYHEDHVTAAINDAIRIEETIKEDVDRNSVSFHVSIGIAMGEVVAFETPQGQRDYLGSVVDRAARLCSIASAGAVFVDTATTGGAQMHKISSTVGHALGRQTAEYQGALERASVPGFNAPVEYHEIRWAQQLFGVKSRAVTASIEPRGSEIPPVSSPTKVAAARADRGVRGTVAFWNEEKGRGPLSGSDGEEFYCDRRFVVGGDDLEADDIVYFCPVDPNSAGKHRIAAACVYVGQDVDGVVVAVRPEGYGFIEARDGQGNPQDIFFSVADSEAGLQRGDPISATIIETGRGVRAEGVKRRDVSSVAA